MTRIALPRSMAGPDGPEATLQAGGAAIPKLGLGTWMNTGQDCVESVRTALELGYRHVDTAQVYGNEEAVGEGIATADVDREAVFLTTKIWRSNLAYDDVIDSVRESLDRLGVDSVDLLLIHWPHPRRPVEETLRAMAELQERGLVSHLGVANFTRNQLREAVEIADRPLVTDQVLYHPLKDQSTLRQYCVEQDIALTAYSPLARGAVIGDEQFGEIGERHGKTAVQVALRWLLQQEGVVAIPKATSQEHLEENLDVFDFALTDEEMRRIHDRQPGLRRRLLNRLPGLMRRNPLP
jgi:diketogulonate reductase-like aldo/keto reductase